MPSPTTITVAKLSRLIGLPHCPLLIDVRSDDQFGLEPYLIPGSVRRRADDAARWSAEPSGRPTVVVCGKGTGLSQGIAAHLRHVNVPAETLEGGFAAWRAAQQPLVRAQSMPPPDHAGRTVWVTRARPKIDRIACPWLIKRFVDPTAVFLYVAPTEVLSVAERFQATPFDVDGVRWSHRGDHCSFDTMLDEFGLDMPALQRLATIVRGADTARLDLAPEAAGLLAVSLGLSRIYRDDLEQVTAAMLVYDGLYRWARDAADETHNWPAGRTGS